MKIDYLLFPIFGYLVGSIPFALVITQIIKGIDIRESGSGHVTTTNTIRQAGWLPGIVVAILDFSKGYMPIYLAKLHDLPVWIISITAGLIVIGHCWPIFARFRGGMGLATTGGILFAVSLLSFLVAFAVLLACVLLIKHAARGAVIAAILTPIIFFLLDFNPSEIIVGVSPAIVITIRFYFEDWHREYRELWLDRE